LEIHDIWAYLGAFPFRLPLERGGGPALSVAGFRPIFVSFIPRPAAGDTSRFRRKTGDPDQERGRRGRIFPIKKAAHRDAPLFI